MDSEHNESEHLITYAYRKASFFIIPYIQEKNIHLQFFTNLGDLGTVCKKN